MNKLISECISPEMFTRFSYKVLIRNETSRTQIANSDLISIKELKDNGIVLEIPINTCQKNHNLTVFILKQGEGVNKKIKIPEIGTMPEALAVALSKVDQIEVNEEKKAFVIVDLNFIQVDSEIWKKIIGQYKEKQDFLDNMFMNQYAGRDKDE